MGKKKKEEHENLERWLVSYADFITLLFAFFVVMYSISKQDSTKTAEASASMQSAFNFVISVGDYPIGNVMGFREFDPGSVPNYLDIERISRKKKNSLSDTIQFKKTKDDVKKLKEKLDDEISSAAAGKEAGVNVSASEEEVRITLPAHFLFRPGSDKIKIKYVDILEKIAKVLKKVRQKIYVEGHTDNIPMSPNDPASNWELSSSRAAKIVRYFILAHKMPSSKFRVIGYADQKPLVPNTTDVNRKKNRRVSIVISFAR